MIIHMYIQWYVPKTRERHAVIYKINNICASTRQFLSISNNALFRMPTTIAKFMCCCTYTHIHNIYIYVYCVCVVRVRGWNTISLISMSCTITVNLSPSKIVFVICALRRGASAARHKCIFYVSISINIYLLQCTNMQTCVVVHCLPGPRVVGILSYRLRVVTVHRIASLSIFILIKVSNIIYLYYTIPRWDKKIQPGDPHVWLFSFFLNVEQVMRIMSVYEFVCKFWNGIITCFKINTPKNSIRHHVI